MAEVNPALLQVAEIYKQKYGTTDQFKQYLIAQMRHESSNGYSPLAQENLNFGGLTQSEWNGDENRQTDGGSNYYRVFNSPEEYATALHDDFFQYYPEIHNAQSASEYAHILKANGYYTGSEEEYASDMENMVGENVTGGVFSMTNVGKLNLAPIVAYLDTDPYDEHTGYQKQPFLKELSDSFFNEFYNNGTVAFLRNQFTNAQGRRRPDEMEMGTWKPTEAQVESVQKMFEGDLEAQHMLLTSATSSESLMNLIRMKLEDKKRQKRVDDSGWGLKSLGGLAGMVLDPLNFVPAVGQEALLAKLATKVGTKAIARIGANKAIQLAEIGVTNGLINVADQEMAKKYGGFKSDPVMAFAFGSAMGAGAKYLHMSYDAHKAQVKDTPHMDKLKKDIEVKSEQALMNNADIPVPEKVLAPSRENLSEFTKAIQEREGFSTPEDMASNLLANKKTKKYNSIAKEYKENFGITQSEFHTMQQQIKAGETIETPQVIRKGNGIEINRVPQSETSIITEAFTNKNHIYPTDEPKVTPHIKYFKEDPIETDEVEQAFKSIKDRPIEVTNNPEESNVEPTLSMERIYGKGGVTAPEVVRQETQGSSSMNGLKEKLETNRILGTTYGQLANSVSNTLRHVANTLLQDPRKRGANIGTNIEIAKKAIKSQYDIPMEKMTNAYRKWYLANPYTHLTNPQDSAMEFNELVSKAFHDKYRRGSTLENYEPEIREAVTALKEFRDTDLRLSERAGLIDSEAIREPNELWRRVDKDKAKIFASKFETLEDAENFLREYYLRAIDRSKLNEGQDVYQLADWLSKSQLRGDIEELDNDLAEALDISHDVKGDKRLAYFKSRIPVNTDTVMPLEFTQGLVNRHKGEIFSFDTDLRDTNVVNHMHYVSNRSSGAIALKQELQVDNIAGYAHELHTRAVSELQEGIKNGWITPEEAEESIKDLHRVIHNITGARIFEDEVRRDARSIGEQTRDLILESSYAMNGLNFGLSALAEHVGAVSQVGARAFTHFIPLIGDFVHDIVHNKFHGKNISAKQLRAYKNQVIGTYMTDSIFFDPRINNREMIENMTLGNHMELLGQTRNGVHIASKITSALSRVQQITNRSIQSIKADLIPDILDWADGEFHSTARANLFSEKSFRDAGIDKPEILKNQLKFYFGNIKDLSEDAIVKADRQWQQDDLSSWTRFHVFLDQKAQEAVLQPTLGNGNFRATDGRYAKYIVPILLQFKQFSRMALNSHLMRGLEDWRREDTIQTLATALSGGLLWALRQEVYANYTYGDNEERRKKFLEKTLTVENLLHAGITRSSVLSSIGFGEDAYNIITGNGTNTRTTVDRPEWTDDLNLLGQVGERLDQFPALATPKRIFNGALSVPEALESLVSDKRLNKEDANAIQKLFPYHRYMPIQVLLSQFADISHNIDKNLKSTKKPQRKRPDELEKEQKNKPQQNSEPEWVQELEGKTNSEMSTEELDKLGQWSNSEFDKNMTGNKY